MKTNRIQLLLALIMTASASAKDTKPPGGHRPPPPPPLLAVLDSNHNGELNEDEIANASSALLELDKDGDGQLTRMELMPPPPKKESATLPPPPPRPDKRPPLLIAVLDLDKDGILSAAEIEAASDSLLTLDKNEDGVISQKELHPGKPPAKDPA